MNQIYQVRFLADDLPARTPVKYNPGMFHKKLSARTQRNAVILGI